MFADFNQNRNVQVTFSKAQKYQIHETVPWFSSCFTHTGGQVQQVYRADSWGSIVNIETRLQAGQSGVLFLVEQEIFCFCVMFFWALGPSQHSVP